MSDKSPTTDAPRVLLVVFDALRPDMVSPELMPRLTRFASTGVRFSASRAVFPTETRVNQCAMVTGCRPGRHGIVGNQFIEPVASPGALFNTGDEDALREGDARLGGELLGVPSLGEYLSTADKRLATLSSGTPGGGRILHHRAERVGGFRLAMHRPDHAVPADVYSTIEKRIGPIPPHTIPSVEWLGWCVDAWLEYVEPEIKPDVGIIWLCEPDNSFHYTGVGSPESLDAIRRADTEFGRLLDNLPNSINIITASDHGQIAVKGKAIDLAALLTSAGFSVGAMPGGDVDVALAIHSGGGLFVKDRDAALIRKIAAWLSEQVFVGAVSVDPQVDIKDEYFSHADLGIDGPRAPDIGLVLRANDDKGPHGWTGATVHDAYYPDGGGIHGGLHARELNNWLACSGPAFKQGLECATTTGVIDVLPTILEVMNVDGPPEVDGRVLHEALRSTPGQGSREGSGVWRGETLTSARGDQLHVSHVGASRYLDALVSAPTGSLRQKSG